MEDIITRMPATELAAVCICAVIVILRLFMKKLPAKYSYCLWAILLIRLLMPFTISSAVSMFNLIPDVSEIFASDSAGREVQEAPQAENDIPAPAVVYDVHNGVYTQYPAHNGTAPISAPAGDTDTKPLSWKTVALVIWLSGIAAIAVYSTVSMIRLRALLRGAVKRGDVMVCRGIDTPFVFGLIHPRIYIPAGISDSELPYIIAHERVHIHRGDHIIKPLAFAVLTLHWFDPVLWAAFRLMENDMERSCDEAAVAAFDTDVRKDYAKALLGISAGSSMRGARLVSFGNSSAKSRIKNILSRKNKGLIATVTAVTVIGVSSVCMLTGAAGKLSLDGITRGLVGYTQITPSSPPGDAYIAYSPVTDIPELKGILKSARSAKAPVLPESYSQYNIELVSGDTTEILLHIPLVGDERTIVCEKTIQSRSAAKQRKVSVEYYTLSSKSHDRLMEFVTRSDEPFPAGHYTGTDEHYEAIVTKTDDTKQIEIIMDRIPLAVLSVPQRYGLEMTNVQGMVTAVYQGYGLFEVTSAPFSSLMIPCGFVYDGDHSETIGFTTDNELYDKAEKQMKSIVKQLINDRNYFLEDKGTTSLTGDDISYDFYNDLMSGTFIAAVYTSESEKTYMSFRFSSGGQLEYLGDTAALPDSAYLISHGTFGIDQ